MAINVTGGKEIQRKLNMLQNPRKVLRPPMERSLVMLHGEIAPYPPQAVPIEVYKRTGKLGAAWTTKIKANANRIIGTIGNNRKYAIYVQGDRQRDFHARAGWTRADTTLDKNEGKIIGFFQDAIDKALRR